MGASQSSAKEPDSPAVNEGQQSPITSVPSAHQTDANVVLNDQADHSTTAETPTSASSTSNAPSSTAEEVFKVPFLPSASTSTFTSTTSSNATLRALPSDIEHILSLNAHAPDEALKLAASNAGKEVAEVVREMKEKALRGDEVKMESEEEKGRRKEMGDVEREMEKRGITRQGEVIEVEQDGQGEDEEMGEIKEDKKDVKMDDECVFISPRPFFPSSPLLFTVLIPAPTPSPTPPPTSTSSSPPPVVTAVVAAAVLPPTTPPTVPTTTTRTAEAATAVLRCEQSTSLSNRRSSFRSCRSSRRGRRLSSLER